jgi:hypothetical protein
MPGGAAAAGAVAAELATGSRGSPEEGKSETKQSPEEAAGGGRRAEVVAAGRWLWGGGACCFRAGQAPHWEGRTGTRSCGSCHGS